MSEIGGEFNESNEYPRQVLSHDRVLATRPQARQALKEFLIECSKNIKGVKFEIGPDKDLKTAENKAIRDYGGDIGYITDFVRAKMVVNSPEQIQELLSDEFQDFMRERGIRVADMNNYFSDPKDRTGYRCINLKLAFPVGEDEHGNIEEHIVELQVVAEQIEAVYNETHTYKRRAEEAEDEIAKCMKKHGIYELKNKEISGDDLSEAELKTLQMADAMIKPLKRTSKLNYAACYLKNAQAAQGTGKADNYETLLDPDKRSKHLLSHGKKERLESMVFKADMEIFECE